ncbi:MAG: hypothetical protein V9G24_16165 [Rhodoblastus sp.]
MTVALPSASGWVMDDLADLRILKDRSIEVDGFFGLAKVACR